MHKIHPIWQQEEQSVSRRPAAIVGMLIVLGIGVSFFYGFDTLLGQLTTEEDTTLHIRITADGFDPPQLRVMQGKTITWINETDTPHILESETLCNATDDCLITKTLFAGDRDTFTVSSSLNAGIYPYGSVIDESMQGEILIEKDTPMQEIPTQTETTDTPLTDFAPTDFAPPSEQANNPAIPRNPYTADTNRIHPFDDLGEPVPEAFPESTPAPVTSPKPLRQPQTGAAEWIVIVGSIAALLWFTRNANAWRKCHFDTQQ